MLSATIHIIDTLERHGHIAYVVGGAVRDLLLGRPITDIDLATSARPEEVNRLFPESRLIGEQFGVVQVQSGGLWFDVATFRRDVGVKDGRHPREIKFVPEEEDALRRDFTINALFLRINVKRLKAGMHNWGDLTRGYYDVVDYVDGLKDLRSRKIRFVGDPQERIREDNLRILRALRFVSQLKGFKLETKTCRAIKDFAHLISNVSAERVKIELEKGFSAPGREQFLQNLSDLGLLAVLLPEVDETRGVMQSGPFHLEGDVFKHTKRALAALPEPVDPILAWAIIFHDIGKKDTRAVGIDGRVHFHDHEKVSALKAESIMRRLRFSAKEIATIVWLIRAEETKRFAQMKLWRVHQLLMHPQAERLVAFMRADDLGKKPPDRARYREAERRYLELRSQRCVYEERLRRFHNATAVRKSANVPDGPELGKVLDAVERGILGDEIKDEESFRLFVMQIDPT